MPSVTLTKIRRANGKVMFQFGKRELEFENLAAAQAYADSLLDREALEALVIKMVITRARNIPNVALFEGRTLTIDLTQNNFGNIS